MPFQEASKALILRGGTESPTGNLGRRPLSAVADAFTICFYMHVMTYFVRHNAEHILDEFGYSDGSRSNVSVDVAGYGPSDHSSEYLDERIAPRHTAGLLEQRADNDVELHAT